MIAAYVFVASHLGSLPAVESLVADLADEGRLPGIPILWIILFAALILPFSSAALFIVLALDLFGAVPVFWTAFTAGLAATATTYAIGRFAGGLVRSPRLQEPIAEASAALAKRRRMVGLLTFVVRAVPNPLYDAWGYACGILRVPFLLYFPAAVAGGLVPLTVLCFGLELVR
jgi:membrane protein YqaA with SNARE-associated domain